MTDSTGRRRWVVGALAAAVVLAVVGTLSPFRLDLPRWVANQVERGGDGLTFRRGVATVPAVDARELLADLDDGEVEVVLEVTTDGPQGQVEAAPGEPAAGPARILTVSEDISNIDLMVGQWDSDLIVRLRRGRSELDGRPSLAVEGVLDDARHEVVLRLRSEGAVVLLDGVAVGRFEGPVGRDGGWDAGHGGLLGNEHGGTRPWAGTVHRAVLRTADGEVDLVQASVIPERLRVRPDRWTGSTPWWWPVNPTPSQAPQAVVFGAIGVLSTLVWPDRRGRTIVGWSVVLSAALLAMKFLVATRHPSLADLVVEVAAAAVGVAAARFVGDRAGARQPG